MTTIKHGVIGVGVALLALLSPAAAAAQCKNLEKAAKEVKFTREVKATPGAVYLTTVGGDTPKANACGLNPKNTSTELTGWGGPLDTDNASIGDGVGKRLFITIGGVRYERGLGTHSPATYVYDISAVGATKFSAVVGMDDGEERENGEALIGFCGNGGSAAFVFSLDGREVLRTPTITGVTDKKQVDGLPVEFPIPAGSKELTIHITNGGDKMNCDHADIGDAKLITSQSAQSVSQLPRTADGKPDFTGLWRTMNTANDNILPHSADHNVPAGLGVVEGNALPYLPAALAKVKENYASRSTLDTENKCYLPGVPRIMYVPYPFQVVQTPDKIIFLFEYLHAVRNVYMNKPHPPGPIEWWMGDSRGTWEGDTLVVDVVHFNAETWFDRAGNYHSEDMHIVERYSLMDRDHISYSATVEDPKVFSRPWTMSMVLYRLKEPNAQLLDYECYAFPLNAEPITPPTQK